MSDNNSNFDFQEYQKEHEGLISKTGTSVKAILLKILRFSETSVIVNIIACIFALIQVLKACSSTDPGVIIEERTAEMTQNAKETMQLMYSVTLPDSIEKLNNVVELRALQNKLYAIELQYVSLTSDMDFKGADDPHKDIMPYIGYLTQQINMLNDWGDVATIMERKNVSINPFLLKKARRIQDDCMKYFSGILAELRKVSESTISPEEKYKKAISLMGDLLLSKEYVELNRYIHRTSVAIVTWSNVQLLKIKVENAKP